MEKHNKSLQHQVHLLYDLHQLGSDFYVPSTLIGGHLAMSAGILDYLSWQIAICLNWAKIGDNC